MGGKDVVAEQMVIGSGQPIRQRRLLQVADAIHLERDPVAALCHMLRGGGVGGVGVVEQRRREQGGEMHGNEDQQQ